MRLKIRCDGKSWKIFHPIEVAPTLVQPGHQKIVVTCTVFVWTRETCMALHLLRCLVYCSFSIVFYLFNLTHMHDPSDGSIYASSGLLPPSAVLGIDLYCILNVRLFETPLLRKYY